MIRRTKIVCTLGPASNTEDKIRALIRAGMNVARLNFSHGTHAEHARVIRRIRRAAAKLGEPVAILQDLQGPKIRVGDLPSAGVLLKAEDEVVFTTGRADIKRLRLPVTYARLHRDVKAGERILLDDGLLSARVVRVRGRDVVCRVVDGGALTSHKGVNFPDSNLSVSAITEKDRSDVIFGAQQGVDWMALSFVRSADDILRLKRLISRSARGVSSPAKVMAKIEKPEAVKNLPAIIRAADGIMVARGDLGIETPAEEVPLIQKRAIEKCRAAAKPVIVATQMLDSMTRNPRPTRAEVSDVANAVIDHADAVMLSGETATGKYPVETVRLMARIARTVEASRYDDVPLASVRARDAATRAVRLAQDASARFILVLAPAGELTRRLSSLRPELPIRAAAADERQCRQLNLLWGVVPFVLNQRGLLRDAGASRLGVAPLRALASLKSAGLVKSGEKFVLVAPSVIEVRRVT